MSHSVQNSPFGILAVTVVVMLMVNAMPSTNAFTLRPSSTRIVSSTSSLYALNKRGKFNKQKDLAAKMAEAKRQRELAEGGDDAEDDGEKISNKEIVAAKKLSAQEIKERNDRQRFADMLENSMSSGGDLEKGYYLTVEQENENADAVCE